MLVRKKRKHAQPVWRGLAQMAAPGDAVDLQTSFAPQPRASTPVPSPSPQAASVRVRFLDSLGNTSTRRAYRAALSAWGSFLQTTDDAAVGRLLSMDAQAAKALVQRWLTEQVSVEVSPSLRNQRLATLRALIKFAGQPWQLDVPSAPVPKKAPPPAWRCERPTCAGIRGAPCCSSPARAEPGLMHDREK